MKISEVVDRLIYIKDNYELTEGNLQAINNACNLLDHDFNSDVEAETIINSNYEK